MVNKEALLQTLNKKLIVSCQALEDEPLHSSYIMSRMAVAAKQGGAAGIRANSKEDIAAMKETVDLPIIGIVKRDYADSPVYITATMKEIEELVSVGTEMIALDATKRIRPNKITLEEFIQQVKTTYPDQLLMADIATLDEAILAQKLGFDVISTTLIGYTEESKGHKLYENDFALLKEILEHVSVPVFAEGNVYTPEAAKRCLELGCHAVVVGGAITRPQQITQRFVHTIES
ncbi:N-acetylmannosamine-6-phosphate 2-epimerase [Risungbinella massiliensis]|uniref:N-acetylmannosamine-6-phosphate 2-epimerase n=1 Tax=Risungbinella massiliensis TaxID=1329796 RepID=UPI0005CB92DB|nr:N-acetylmannosamine-6-phosphate 2-epimerase [Risungbinella massiliensis]